MCGVAPIVDRLSRYDHCVGSVFFSTTPELGFSAAEENRRHSLVHDAQYTDP